MPEPAGSTSTDAPESGATTTLRTEDKPTTPTEQYAKEPGVSRGQRFRKWRARFIVLVMIAIAAYVAWMILQSQATRDATLDLGNVTLTSQPIPVMNSLTGLVTAVDVRAGQRVAEGQQVGELRVTTTNSQGKFVQVRQRLRAPRAGIVVDDPMTLGSTLQSSTAFVELYDPQSLTLVADVPLGFLPQIHPGMVAKLKAENLATNINAVVLRAVPRVGTGQDTVAKDRLHLVLVPQNPAQVVRLIPGLRFTGSIDTSASDDTKTSSVYVD